MHSIFLAQTFTVVPDTGTSNYWIVSSNCTSQACTRSTSGYTKKRFDSSKSSSFSQKPGTPFLLPYNNVSHNGYLRTDVLSFAGLTAKEQIFGLADYIADYYGYEPIDGIMGMAWPGLAWDGTTPPMQNVVSQLSQPIFTVWMEK